MEKFPVLFLGTAPSQTPALYSLMTYSGIKQGTFYPMGGFGKVIDAFAQVCKEKGVEFFNNETIEKINVENNFATSMTSNNRKIESDIIIGSADYHHIENNLLDKKLRNYSEKYWEKRTFSPSSLIFYIGVGKKVKNLIVGMYYRCIETTNWLVDRLVTWNQVLENQNQNQESESGIKNHGH